MNRCPRCKSDDVKEVDYMGSIMLVCGNCGYDERQTYDVFPESKTSQKAKKEFSPYKSGGRLRIKK